MRHLKLGTILAGIAALSLVLLGGTAMAEYPDKPVTCIVNYGAGGTTDLTSRFALLRGRKALGPDHNRGEQGRRRRHGGPHLPGHP